MHDILRFLSAIPDRTPGSGIYSCYIVKDGSIYATSRAKGMTAGVEMESPVNFAVPSTEMDEALKRMKQISELTVEEGCLLIKGGRLKSSIELDGGEAPPFPAMPDDWWQIPTGFAAALKLALPFIGDRHWSAGIRLWGDKITAMSNNAAIQIDAPGLALDDPAMLTADTVNFLVTQDDPTEVAFVGESLMFRWDDGRWLFAQVLNAQMPEQVVQQIFAKGGEEAPVAIDDECREAYADAAALSDGTVWVRPGGFEGRKGVGKASTECKMALPEEHRSAWTVKALDAVMACAEAWNPNSFPDVSLFIGKGLRGVIVGVNK